MSAPPLPILAALLVTLAAAHPAKAEELPEPTFNAHELENIWRACAVSGRSNAAKVECIHAQAGHMLEEKKVERDNRRMEALTRKELSEPEHGE